MQRNRSQLLTREEKIEIRNKIEILRQENRLCYYSDVVALFDLSHTCARKYLQDGSVNWMYETGTTRLVADKAEVVQHLRRIAKFYRRDYESFIETVDDFKELAPIRASFPFEEFQEDDDIDLLGLNQKDGELWKSFKNSVYARGSREMYERAAFTTMMNAVHIFGRVYYYKTSVQKQKFIAFRYNLQSRKDAENDAQKQAVKKIMVAVQQKLF